MRSVGDWQTERRLRALELSKTGWPQNRIAEAPGVTKAT
jgi:transcriptional regulator